ncbi:hypothetical protein OG21DRAFT_952330 [Imleria badia]|nr:hypothetical protein OG21DRAFT_952330 [Imleria badia]
MGSLGDLSACVYSYLCNESTLYCGWVCFFLLSRLRFVRIGLLLTSGVQAVELVVLLDHFFTAIATSSLAVAAGVDVVIAVFLTFLLVRKRIATGYASTAHILQRLMLFAVNAGIWTATFALLSLVLVHRAFHCHPFQSDVVKPDTKPVIAYVSDIFSSCSVFFSAVLGIL